MVESFYNIADKLDRLKNVEQPTQKDIEEITKYLVGSEYIRYFFHDLNNPSWIQPLYKLGWFNKAPPPLEDKNQPGYFSMPFWFEGEYLKRTANKFPSIVRDVAFSLETDNSRAIRTMLEALLEIPVNFTAETVSKFREWVETPFVNFMTLSQELGTIMDYLAKGGHVESALAVLDILLEPIQVKERFEEDKLVASSRYDYYWLNEALQKNLPALIEMAPIGVVNVAEKQLIKAIELEHDPRIDEKTKKLNSYWRLSIAPRSEANYDSEIKNLLVDTIITSLNASCEQKLDVTYTTLIRFIENDYSIFRRIAIFILRKWGEQYPDLLKIAYFKFKEELISAGKSEFNRFLEIQFKNFPDSVQKEIIQERMIPDSQHVEDVLKNNAERINGETIEEKRQTIIEKWQLEDLAPLANYLENENKEHYEKLLKKYGEPSPRPESGMVVTSWVGPESPIEIGELSKKTIKEVVQDLINFVPSSEDSFGKPSREGLARTLETDVQARANYYANNAVLFIDESLPFVYHTHLLRGLEKALKNQEKYPLSEVFELCMSITYQDKDKFKKQDYEEGLSAAKLAVVQLFEEIFRVKEPYIENGLLEKSGQIIVELLRQDEPFPEQPDGFDPATHSLNSIHGVAMHSLVAYGLYCERKRKVEMGDDGKPIMIPLVKETLTEKLDKTINPSLSVHSVLGWYFPQFIYLDKEWALENRERIFPIKEELARYWKAAWSAYIRFSDVYTNVFPELLRQYQRALEELPDSVNNQGLDRSDQQMATHILKAYLLDMIKLDSEDGLIHLYYQKSDDETRSHGNFWLSQVLESQKPSAKDMVWQKIWSLWQWRIEEAISSDDQSNFTKEISSFSRLLKNSPLELSELQPVLLQMLKFKFGSFENEKIIEYLGKNCEKYPSISVTLLYQMISSSRDFYLLDEAKIAIEKTLTFALAGDSDSKAKAIEIINIFGERGDYSWRPLLDIPENEEESPTRIKVFINYAREDRALVRKLYNELEKIHWLDPWLDEEKILPGQDWDVEIGNALKEADAILVCMSKVSAKKIGIIQSELQKVERLPKNQPNETVFLIPVLLEEFRLPDIFRKYQWVDVSQPDRVDMIVRSLETLRTLR